MILYMLRGLPGSGKTTHAKRMVQMGVKRVNRDELRDMVDSGVYNAGNERLIRLFATNLVLASLKQGYDTVIDNTNLKPNDELEWQTLAFRMGAKFVVIDMNVSLEECIRRDAQRDNPVGAEAIRSMQKLEPNPLLI